MTKKNRSVVLAKLDQMLRSLARIEARMPKSLENLKSDPDTQDIVAHNLQKVIQSAADTAAYICSLDNQLNAPQSMAECFDQLRETKLIDFQLSESLKKAVGLRNVLVHEYEGVNWEIIYFVLKNNLKIFHEFAEVIFKNIPKN